MSYTAPASSSTVSVNQIENVTIKVGQQATLPCFVTNLGSFKVNNNNIFFFFNDLMNNKLNKQI